MSKKPRYITVDVVLRTNHGSKALIRAFEATDEYVQKNDWGDRDGLRWCIVVSLCPERNADACIRKFCEETFKAFSPKANKQWFRAGKREFFIGYDLAKRGKKNHCFQDHLSGETIALAANLKAGIGSILYRQT